MRLSGRCRASPSRSSKRETSRRSPGDLRLGPPPLNTVVRLIAQLGGFLGRKGDGDPGVKTLWLGMRDVAVFVQGLRFAKAAL